MRSALYLRLLILPAFVLCTSCEGYRCIGGVVYDKATGRALDSLVCQAKTVDRMMVTDSSGKFDICNGMGGCVPDCKEIVVQLSREGYKPLLLRNEKDSVFYLEKQ